MPLIPERFLRFAIRDLKAEIEHSKNNMIVSIDTSEQEFWLSRLNEYYALEHGDLEENARIDEARIREKLVSDFSKRYATTDEMFADLGIVLQKMSD